jgi:primosomal protein N' (replication factor Y) (superfamily II helicase)
VYAELVVNVEAPLAGTFHYHVPGDLLSVLKVGQLVEVEFGQRLAQGIIIAFDERAPVEETKPVIGIIDPEPVVQPWQIALAGWLSQQYLAPLNACLRLMLPPGLSRWADITLDLNPNWDGSGRLTELQQLLVEVLREKGDRRGRQIQRALPKKHRGSWKTAANQLVRRNILRKATILDPPRARPKVIRTAELAAGPARIRDAAMKLGSANKQADILHYLATSSDPLPSESTILAETGAQIEHLALLARGNLIQRTLATTILVPAGSADDAPPDLAELLTQLPLSPDQLPEQAAGRLIANGLAERVEQPAAAGLAIAPSEVTDHLFRLRRGTKYLAVLVYLARAASAVAVSDLYAATGAGINHLRKLASLELIRLGQEEVWRDPLADRDFVASTAPTLTADQARAWGRIKIAMIDAQEREPDDPAVKTAPKPFLIHGVTGSGKTEIYMRAIDFALQRGLQAIVLVPEIALTPQTVRRFAARFPGQIAVLHSRLSDGERFDTWRRARQGLFDIVIGPRSALFTPLQNIGVIVIDEEHDNSYKQTPPVPPPYYHARDLAIELGATINAIVIMGSATPDIVSYHRAKADRYHLLEMPKRIMGHRQRIGSQSSRLQRPSHYHQETGDPEEALTIPLPPVQIVDLRQELRAGNRSIFSRTLQKSLSEVLERGEQAILFLNRRGTASFVMCRDCGLILKCPRCDTPLTYHRPGMMLACHYCGRKEPYPEECPQCDSKRIKFFGLGTEEVEHLVQQRWPGARTVRWDRDTTAGKDTHETLLASFINQEADILIGTQMIAKGLDLPLVTLVGVISADVSLGLPDYHTGERTFQILAQVAGRAGRGLLGGRVVIQTYQPDHYAIQAAAEHDFVSFYLEEIRFRTQHTLPPFRRMARLLISDPVNGRAERQARELTQALKLHIREQALGATELVGPVPPFFSRLDGRYRWQIIVRTPDPVRLLSDFPIPANWIIDIDPVSIL